MSVVIEPTWRTARADAIEAVVNAINDALDHVANVEDALENDEPLLTAARTFTGLCRSRRTDLISEMRRLRETP